MELVIRSPVLPTANPGGPVLVASKYRSLILGKLSDNSQKKKKKKEKKNIYIYIDRDIYKRCT